MSDSLAIEWGNEKLVLLQGKVSGKHINAKVSAILTWPAEIDPDKDSLRAGEWLKGELTSRGIGAKQALVSLPRESVVVRHLELPNIPDAELPGMVKLQAATKVTLAADKYLLDYVPLPARGSDTRDVLMTTVPTDVTKVITKILTAAGLEIASIGVTSLHAGEIVCHQQDAKVREAKQLVLSVSLAGNQIELALMRGNCALATSATNIEAEGDGFHKSVNAEINRLRLSAQSLHGGLPVSHVWVAPSDPRSQDLCAFLKDKLNCEGSCFDPLGGTGKLLDSERGYFVATAGHLFVENSSLTESVNYLSPRKAVVKADRRKARMIMAGVGIAALLGTGYWAFQQRLKRQDEEIQSRLDQVALIKDRLRAGADDMEAAGMVDEWTVRQVDWLEQMEKLNAILPGGDAMLVEKYSFRPGRQDKRASIQIEGIARSRTEVEDVSDLLQKRDYQPGTPQFEDSNRVEDYQTAFTLIVDMPLKDDPS